MRAWARFWEVDAAALQRLPSVEEHVARLEAAMERNRQIRRAAMSRYAREHILPRMQLGDGLLPTLTPRMDGGGLCVLVELECASLFYSSLLPTCLRPPAGWRTFPLPVLECHFAL